eukprot:5114067-Alexandrium_andersonii.AAC.1
MCIRDSPRSADQSRASSRRINHPAMPASPAVRTSIRKCQIHAVPGAANKRFRPVSPANVEYRP